MFAQLLSKTNRRRAVGERRKQRLTRLGSHFVFVGTFAILGGSLRGFNLLLVLAAIVVATILIQWRWVRRSIESLAIVRRLPDWAFAGEPFRVRFQLSNHSSLVPLAMIRIDDAVTEFGSDDLSTTATCGAAFVKPRHTVSPHYESVITKRGRYEFGPLTVSTSFPFGLVNSKLEKYGAELLYVYPRLVQLRRAWRQELDNRSGGMNVTARRSGPTEGDFFGLRDWQTGDNRRWIHWRTTARTDHPVVRQFEQQRRYDTCILVDAYLPTDDPAADEVAAVELAISLAATLVTQLIGGSSNRVVLAIAGTHGDAVLGRGSGEGRHRMLRMLAELEPTIEPDLVGATTRAMALIGYTQDLLVVSSRSLSGAILHQPEIGRTIHSWRRRSQLRWLDVSDPAIDRLMIRSQAQTKSPRHDRVNGQSRAVTPNAMRPDADQTGTRVAPALAGGSS